MKNFQVLLALAGCTAAGVATGMLLAPCKGSEMRGKIKNMLRHEKLQVKEHLVQYLKGKGITLPDEEITKIFNSCNCSPCECDPCDCDKK